ncbi:TPA: hypothetical protein U1456_001599 [Streptococcus suis]|uniref:hypothetical protein n=1 Tax=Streptococcus suis TaxID=1307 RepID=UPI00022F9652|nr:hypothetical protein [Streptococcus suis]AER21817.1 hypothetical protein SSUST1_1465 [Streptococcus suis ST1]VTT06087.1 membrane protein [Streptococcus suis]HEM3227604.1 hypothetical protein [Streptococcus suis]HEM5434522.1 hypothetical protein [Streptococcus suis]
MKRDKQVLRDKTNIIVDNLLPENKAYFDEIRDYMILKSFFKDEKAILEQIYSMVSDFKMAEVDGLTAVDFFGTDPKDMADQLLKNAPKAPLREMTITYFSAVATLYAIGTFLLFANTGQFQLEFILFLASCTNALLLCWLVFGLLPSVLFKPKASKMIIGLIVLTIIILFNIIFNLPAMIGDKAIYLKFLEMFDWLFVIVTSLATIVFSVKVKVFRTFALPIFAFLLIGIIKKLLVMNLVSGDLWTVWLPIGLLCAAMILFYLQIYQSTKEST